MELWAKRADNPKADGAARRNLQLESGDASLRNLQTLHAGRWSR